jgi:acyl-CoA thioester hydrolase
MCKQMRDDSMIETYKGVVYPNQLDHMDHMNVQWYTSKFDEATWHLFLAVGITNGYIIENRRGMAAIEQITKYKSEVVAGDLLLIKSKILEVGEKTIRFLHIMYNAETEQEVATSELLGVHLDREKRKSCALPDNIKAKCKVLI